MKLHLPDKLRAAVLTALPALACLAPTTASGVMIWFLASLAAPSVQAASLTSNSTEYGNATYSGTILTYDAAGKSGWQTFHNAILTYEDAEDQTVEFNCATSQTLDGVTSSNGWRVFASNQTCSYGQTLRLTGATENVSLDIQFSPFTLGGLITDAGDCTYTLSRNPSGTGSMGVEFLANAATGFNMDIGADTEVKSYNKHDYDNFGITVLTGGTWKVASGKTLTLNSDRFINIGTDETNVTVNIAGGGTVRFNGPTTVNGTIAVASATSLLIEDSIVVTQSIENNGTITFGENASLTLADAVNITGEGTFRFNGATTVNGTIAVASDARLSIEGSVILTQSIENNGTITFGENASLTLADCSGLEVAGTASYSDAVSGSTRNGYANASYYIVKGSGQVAGLDSVILDGETHTLTGTGGNRILSLAGNGGSYFVNEGTVVYGGTGDYANSAAGPATTHIALNGGSLEMQQNLAEGVGIILYADGMVSLNSEVTLGKASVSLHGHALILDGSGTYDLGASFAMGENTSLADTWTGTIKVSGSIGRDAADSVYNLNNLDNNRKGWVELCGVSGFLKEATGNNDSGWDTRIEANLVMSGNGGTAALNLNSGSSTSGRHHEFAGAIKGNGNMEISSRNLSHNKFTFSGDTSGWTGTVKVEFSNQADRDTHPIVLVFGGIYTQSTNVEVGSSNTVRVEVAGDTTDEVKTKSVNGEFSVKTAASGNGSGHLQLETSGTLAKVFTKTINADSITISGGAVTFGESVSTGALTVGAETTMSASLNLTGTATLHADLTVAGDTTLATTAASIAIDEGMTFSTNKGKLKVTGTGAETLITTSADNALVNASNEAITISNASVTVNSEEGYILGAKLSGSTLANTGTGTATVKVEEGSTNDFNASKGSVAVDAQAAAVGNLTVGNEKTVTIGDGTGTATVSGTAALENGSTVGGNVTIVDSGRLEIFGTGFSADGFGAMVEGTLTANADAVSLVNRIDVTDIMTSTTYVLATAQVMDITGVFTAENFYTGTLAEGMAVSVSVQPMGSGTYDIDTATASQLVFTLTAENPGTLTQTAVAKGGVSVNGTNITLTVTDNLAGVTGGFNVTVGKEAWQAIVDGMEPSGGIYQNATVTLTGADGATLDLATYTGGAVTLNKYVGTGTQGEYFVAYIPEPATATLSLLALAALAARRRRK